MIDKLQIALAVILITIGITTPIRSSAEGGNPFSLSLGPVQIGESRIPINLDDFKITSTIKGVKARFAKRSVQWIRIRNNLLTPRARLKIIIKNDRPDLHFLYHGQAIIPGMKKGYATADLYVDLFNPEEIIVSKAGKRIGTIRIHASRRLKSTNLHLIDYSCSRYKLEIKGLKGEYLSLGCRMERIGRWGKEFPRLIVTWSSTNYRLQDGTLPPYMTVLRDSSPANIEVEDDSGNKKIITIQAQLPKRLNRIKTAFGFGPYSFKSRIETSYRDPKVAPAIMLYGNLALSESTSIRGFDALVWQESTFNNIGLYFAYDLANIMDNRINITPLLGAQGLTFRYNDKYSFETDIIYPQGFEVVYRHPFGQENYLLVFGAFLSLSSSSSTQYSNLWVRHGKRIFWELNYISWENNLRSATMWGLSVGIPLFALF
jgi:hypothetical protein